MSMPMILSLACTQLRMTPAEAITAATINGAYALRREERIGSLEAGKQADLAVFEVEDYREIPYYFGYEPLLDDHETRRNYLHAGLKESGPTGARRNRSPAKTELIP